MIKTLLLASVLSLAATGVQAQSVVVQFGPTTEYSTLSCSNFARQADGTWRALNATRFSLGFVQNIVPTVRPIRSGGWIYNNIDLFSQLELQCGGLGAVVAKY